MHDADPAVLSELVRAAGGDPDHFSGRLVTEMLETCLKLPREGHDTGQLKLITSALKEMRYAYRVFNQYASVPKVAIFGSARTPEDHPDYEAAREFGRSIARHGWMSITGAGDGIMKAGHEGPSRASSFGLSIRLPFETTANEVIEGDPKLINFRYFFTRKLMFMSHAHAVSVFPGGYGTQDELFETLVLIQTGKTNLVPVVLVEGAGGDYWAHWDNYVRKSLGDKGWISAEDPNLYYIARSPEDAVQHVLHFYRTYHSSRYVREKLVIRLNRSIDDRELEQLNDEFGVLVASGRIERSGALPEESDHLDLPRIVFHHTRHHWGVVRGLVDRLNERAPAEGAEDAA